MASINTFCLNHEEDPELTYSYLFIDILNRINRGNMILI